jgi:hypothetical protein
MLSEQYAMWGMAGLIAAVFLRATLRLLRHADDRSKFPFVHVNEDGTVRELDADERVYLDTKFHGADGARPYIKSRYSSRTPDNKIWGYLRRKLVPRWIKIHPNP